MSARLFPRDVPNRVQLAVRIAEELSNDDGEVVGGMPALQKALNHDSDRSTRDVVAEAETWKLLKRKGPIGHGPRRVFVVSKMKRKASTWLGSLSPTTGDDEVAAYS